MNGNLTCATCRFFHKKTTTNTHWIGLCSNRDVLEGQSISLANVESLFWHSSYTALRDDIREDAQVYHREDFGCIYHESLPIRPDPLAPQVVSRVVEINQGDGQMSHNITQHTPQTAVDHKEILEAKDRYIQARDEYKRLLFRGQKTADGQPFEFDTKGYWYINKFGIPYPECIEFSLDECSISNDGETITVKRSGKPYYYRLNELYSSYSAAQVALVDVCRDFINRQQEELKALETVAEKIKKNRRKKQPNENQTTN